MGAAVDETTAEPELARRDRSARRANAVGGAGARGAGAGAQEEPEEATVGAGAPVPSWGPLPRDPSHPAVDGSSHPRAAARVAEAARRANTPSLADTTPMPNVGTDGAGESPTARISSAEKPEKNVDGEARAPTQRTDGHEPDATAAIRTRRQHDPDAT